MSKKKPKIQENIVFFDVIYTDGTRSSRRKVNAAGIMKHEEEAFAITEIMAQDRKISEMSGKDRGAIKSVERSES